MMAARDPSVRVDASHFTPYIIPPTIPAEIASLSTTDQPMFTSPALDFAKHSKELLSIADALAILSDLNVQLSEPIDYLKDMREIAEVEDLAQAASALKDKVLAEAVDRALHKFNLLTKPPAKKRHSLKGSEMRGQRPNINSVPSSIPYQNLSTHSFDPTLSAEQRAYYHYLRGYIYLCSTQYNKLAEDNLSSALKLDPSNAEAWRCMGLSYFRKKDLPNARRCFDRAIELKRNEKTLYELSVMIRQTLPEDMEKLELQLEESVSFTKELMDANVQNIKAWEEYAEALADFAQARRLDAMLVAVAENEIRKIRIFAQDFPRLLMDGVSSGPVAENN
ncbi:hypothetical protein HDV00_007020 [Rhizophlyctis rosea]|nr:hypothetical protein HDV00_007020 [Rhizophlyctis rosea]